ncbi:MAG: hypothetical protein WC525_06830 [Candidatus Thermoplasmatota archaeon]
MEIKKILAVSIILLFLGVAVAPSINLSVATASQEDDLVEVTTQAYGIKGYGGTTVELTREQYQNLEEYLVEFRARLNQTSTREEAVPIFKEAVVELDKYGLLPQGMKVTQAQNLVTGVVQNRNIMMIQNKLFSKNVVAQETTVNLFCLIAGQTNCTTFDSIGTLLVSFMPVIFDNVVMRIFRMRMFIFLSLLCMNNPLAVMNRINLGYHTFFGNVSASGWMTTIGSFGMKRIQGNMSGDINVQGSIWWPEISQVSIKNPAAMGFFGIKIGFGTGDPEITLWQGKEFFYIGSALLTAISTD